MLKLKLFLVPVLALVAIGAQQPPPPTTGPATQPKVTVYITKTGKAFHRESCSSLRKSKIAIDREDAVNRGFSACSRCTP